MISTPIRILIADDHNLIREGLKRVLEYQDDMVIVGEAVNGNEAEASVKTLKPDVVIMDVNMPGLSGIQVLRKIRETGSLQKIIILTVAGDRETLMEAVKIGADGYLLKDTDITELIKAVREVNSGETFIDQRLVKLLVTDFRSRKEVEARQNPLGTLTDRELEILQHLASGHSNREIGDRLFLSEKTIKNQTTVIFRKLEVNDRVQATLSALKWGIETFRK